MDEEGRQPNGTRYRYDLPMVPSRAEPRFHGHVWILVDRHSYSNAASVAALGMFYPCPTVSDPAKNWDATCRLIAALPTLFVYVVAGKYFVRGLTAGAVKG